MPTTPPRPFPGGDPRRFTPDRASATPEQLAAHAADCLEWDRAERWGTPPSSEDSRRGYVMGPGGELITYIFKPDYGPGWYDGP